MPPTIGIGCYGPFAGYGWLFQLLILIAFFLIVYWVIRGSKTQDAMEILKKRYAAGEISKKEFEALKRDIQ